MEWLDACMIMLELDLKSLINQFLWMFFTSTRWSERNAIFCTFCVQFFPIVAKNAFQPLSLSTNFARIWCFDENLYHFILALFLWRRNSLSFSLLTDARSTRQPHFIDAVGMQNVGPWCWCSDLYSYQFDFEYYGSLQFLSRHNPSNS